LIHVVLSKKYRTKATVGNLNNSYRVFDVILYSRNQNGIVEMGANHKMKLNFFCELAMPDYGYITNFGKAHLKDLVALQV
jgi:UDP-N-acetylmuramoyl-tripeptide--D-alanyl-D-alanine ligase